MANWYFLAILLTALFCVECSDLEEMAESLSALEAGQNSLRERLQQYAEMHESEIRNVTALCQELKVTVQVHQEILDDLLENKPVTTEAPIDLSGPCSSANHEVLDDEWRSVDNPLDYGDYNHCDSDLLHGWYRFLLHGENAVIPTSCVEEEHCQTHAPQWVDLQGQSLPEVGQEVHARACANWVGDCCNWESPITVRNCGEFFVYHLQPRSTCNLAYCAESQH